jgi:hypothetical protein
VEPDDENFVREAVRGRQDRSYCLHVEQSNMDLARSTCKQEGECLPARLLAEECKPIMRSEGSLCL